MPRLLLAALALLPLAGHALDLTPTRGSRDLEGFRIPVVRFTDGAEKVAYQPPAGWILNGGGDLLSLYPTDRPDVLMQFHVTVLEPLAANAVEDFDAWCRRFLPPDATQTALDAETVSAFTLRGRPSRESTYRYVAQGRRLLTTVAVVDVSSRERLSVVITARSADFKAAREEAIRSLFSMNWGE